MQPPSPAMDQFIGGAEIHLQKRRKFSRRQVLFRRRLLDQVEKTQKSVLSQRLVVLEKVLGTTAEMWVYMQAEYDLWQARRKAA